MKHVFSVAGLGLAAAFVVVFFTGRIDSKQLTVVAPRVGMQTAPGLALSLVTLGAPSLTTCLYRVTPETAEKFLRVFLEVSERGDDAPFTSTCRELMKACATDSGAPFVRSWGGAASFVSYGLLGHRPRALSV